MDPLRLETPRSDLPKCTKSGPLAPDLCCLRVRFAVGFFDSLRLPPRLRASASKSQSPPFRLLLIGAMAFTLVAQSDGERQLETAIYSETVTGDVAAAIGMYRTILSQKGIPRPVAARALWQLGQC